VAEQVPERVERPRRVDVHDDDGGAAVFGKLDGAVATDPKGQGLAGGRRTRHVLDDDPVFGSVQEEVGIFGKVLDVQGGGIAVGQSEGEGSDEGFLRRDDLDDDPLADVDDARAEDVTLAELVLATGGNGRRCVETNVLSDVSVKRHSAERDDAVVVEGRNPGVGDATVIKRRNLSGSSIRQSVVICVVSLLLLLLLPDCLAMLNSPAEGLVRLKLMLLLLLRPADESLRLQGVVVALDQLASEVDHAQGGTGTVQVDHGPQRLPGVDAEVKNAEVFPVEAVVNIPIPGNVKMDHPALNNQLLPEALGPVAWFHGKVWTGVFRQVSYAGGVVC